MTKRTTFLLTLLLLTYQVSFAAVTPSKDQESEEIPVVPSEVSLIVETLKSQQLSPQHKTRFEENLKVIDRLIPRIKTKDLYFLTKTEIYKSVLVRFKSKNVPRYPSNMNLFIEREYKKFNSLGTPFTKWLTAAIKADLIYLSSTPEYIFFSNPQNATVKSDLNIKPIKTRVNILLNWIQFLTLENGRRYEEDLPDLLLDLTEHLARSMKTFVYFTNVKNREYVEDNKPMKYFDFTTQKKESSTSLSIIEEIIDDENKNQKPKQLDSKWVPKDSKQLVPDPNYTPPASLPKPVDDWLDGL